MVSEVNMWTLCQTGLKTLHKQYVVPALFMELMEPEVKKKRERKKCQSFCPEPELKLMLKLMLKLVSKCH